MAAVPLATSSWTKRIVDDLGPTPGRATRSLRVALASVVTMLVLVTLRMPYVAVGLYFVFLANRATPALSLRSSLYLVISVSLAVAAQLLTVALTDDAPLGRPLSIAIIAFVGGVFIHQSSIPTLGSTLGFIYALLIAQWDLHAPANATVESTLWILPTMGVGLGASVLVEYALARQDPVQRLQDERGRRYAALERMFDAVARGADAAALEAAVLGVRQLAAVGQGEMQALYTTIAMRNIAPGALPPATQLRIAMLTRLMDLAAAFGVDVMRDPRALPEERCARLAAFCRLQQGGEVAESQVGARLDLSAEGPESLLRVERSADEILRMPANARSRRELVYEPARHAPILAAGAFEKRRALAFAAKLSLCATVVYVFYRATSWPGISTCVTTVMVTGLNDTGAIKQRLTLRLAGIALGGLLGLACVTLIFPRVDTITALVLVVAVISFALSWWAGGRQFGYLGVQMAYAFYAVALTDARPAIALAPARDNFGGVVLATLVMWVVFDQLWPTTTRALMRHLLADALRKLGSLVQLRGSSRSHEVQLVEGRALRFEVGTLITALRASSESAHYEFGPNRARDIEEAGRIVNAAFDVGAMFFEELATLYGAEGEPMPAAHPEEAAHLEALAAAVEVSSPRADLEARLPATPDARPSYLRVRDDVLRLLGGT